MKKITFLIFSMLAITSFLKAQNGQEYLDRNDSYFFTDNSGVLFRNPSGMRDEIKIPKSSLIKEVFFPTNLWHGAYENQGDTNYIIGYNHDMEAFGRDIFKGPYSTGNNYEELAYKKKWNTAIWKLQQKEVTDFHRWRLCELGIETQGCAMISAPSQETLDKIQSWPGNGDALLGEAAQLAPYVDYNKNGIYDPNQGDYPKIKGCEAIYFILNDEGGEKYTENTGALGFEVHVMIYQYEQAFSFLNTTCFVDVMTINRGNKNYEKVLTGIQSDGDMGDYGDDYIGMDSTRNLVYFYNGSNDDDYLEGNPPAMGIMALRDQVIAAPFFAPSAYFTGGFSNWDIMKSEKTYLINYLQFQYPDAYPTRFQFQGNPLLMEKFSESFLGNQPGERMGMLTNEYQNFKHNDTLLQTYAIIYSNIGNNLENAQDMLYQADKVRGFFNGENSICIDPLLSLNEQSNAKTVSIFPNPTEGIVRIKAEKGAQINNYTLRTLSGKVLLNEKPRQGQDVELDLKHHASGVYLLELTNESNRQVFKVIKQ